MPLEAIIFDFDGVLVNSEHFWEEEEQIFYRKIIPGWKSEDHNLIVGMRMIDIYDFLSQKFGISISLPEFLREYDAIAERIYAQCTPSPGVEAFLRRAASARLSLAIASSARKKWLELVLAKFRLQLFFPVIVGAEDIPDGSGKPSPTIYLLTAERLGMIPRQCVAIEDARNGVIAAKNAGMTCIALRTNVNAGQDLSQADMEIQSFDSLSIEELQSLSVA
jgi:HAD superfamily hydrolase (TIGR01509 family)